MVDMGSTTVSERATRTQEPVPLVKRLNSGPTTVTLARPHADVWLVAIYDPPDNRLTAGAMRQLSKHLDTVEMVWREENRGGRGSRSRRGGALVLTSANPKFFCNGLAMPSDPMLVPHFIGETWEALKIRLLTFPLLTIAAINGHAFGGGLLLSLTCDLRLMTSGKGLLSINELLIGMPLNAADCALLRTRVTPEAGIGQYSGWVMRDILIGKRFTQGEALAIGLLDQIVDDGGDHEILVRRAIERGAAEGKVVASGAWSGIKDVAYQHLRVIGAGKRRTSYPAMEEAAFWDRVGREGAKL